MNNYAVCEYLLPAKKNFVGHMTCSSPFHLPPFTIVLPIPRPTISLTPRCHCRVILLGVTFEDIERRVLTHVSHSIFFFFDRPVSL